MEINIDHTYLKRMKISLDHDPSILTGRAPTSVIQPSPPLSQFEAPNHHPESNATSMGDVVITISPALNETATIRHGQLHHYKKFWKLVFDAALFSIFPTLTQVSQLKFSSESPFETHVFFSNMGVVAYVIALGTSILFFAMAKYLEKFGNERSSHVYYSYLILRCVFCFTVILAPISFVLVLLIPKHGYYWIGYLVISLLFLVTVIHNVNDYFKLRHKRALFNLGRV